MLVTMATAFDDHGNMQCASLWCHVTQRQRSGQLDLICYMNDDIGLINVNVISLSMSLEITEASAGLDQCYLLSLAWTLLSGRISRPTPSFTRQLMTV